MLIVLQQKVPKVVAFGSKAPHCAMDYLNHAYAMMSDGLFSFQHKMTLDGTLYLKTSTLFIYSSHPGPKGMLPKDSKDILQEILQNVAYQESTT